MKRNILPLLAIAFVVAIISTGVFYGLFAGKLKSNTTELAGQPIVVAAKDLPRGTVLQPTDLRLSEIRGGLKGSFSKPEDAVGATLVEAIQQNEPLLETRLASRDPKVSKAAGQIPTGFRAVSLRVAESSGIVSLLKPGAKVDVQAIIDRNNSSELKAVVQNIEILSVNPQVEPAAGNKPPAVIVTVLASAQDADSLALADSGARIRVALRNPLDDANGPKRAMILNSLFQPGSGMMLAQTSAPAAHTAAPVSPVAALPAAHPTQLRIQALGVSAAAWGELDALLSGANRDGGLRISPFRSDADAGEILRALEQKQEAEVVSSWTVNAEPGRTTSVRAGALPNQLRVLFSGADASGKKTIKVRPEISLRSGEGVETRAYDGDISDRGSFLVTGWLNRKDHAVLDQLFPGHAWTGRDLVLVVTPHASNEIAATQRER